jgi:hypothetical protein
VVSNLSDAQIEAMSPAERRELIQRLERPLNELLPITQAYRIHRAWLALMIGGTIFLIPWIIYLAFALPQDYTVHDWWATWAGFDVLLLVFMAATVVLGMLRRQLLLLAAFATGVLLICDAWFDIMTAGPNDVWLSVLTAALGELPLAVLLVVVSLRLVRLTATRLWALKPSAPLWRLPLLP